MRSPGGYAANVEAVTTVVPDADPVRRRPGGARRGHPGHADHRHARRRRQRALRASRPAVDRRRHAEERRPRPRAPDAASASCSSSACPATARWTSSASRRPSRRPRSRPPATPTSPRTPSWSAGYIGPAVARPERRRSPRAPSAPPCATCSTRASSPGTRWITGANEPGRHVFDLVAGRDFTADGTVEAAEVRAGDPAPDGSGPLELARGIEIGHIFALGPQVRPGARPDGAGPERQGAGRDDGLLRHRRHPRARRARGGQQRRARAGLAGARRPGARARRRHRQGPGGVRGRRGARHRAVRRAASRCSTTTARARSRPA